RAEEKNGGGRTEAAQGIAARVFLVGNKIVAEISDQFLAQVEVGVFVFAGRFQDEFQAAAHLGRDFRQHALEGVPGLLHVQSEARKLRRIRRDKGRRVGVLGLGGDHFEKAGPAAGRRSQMDFAKGAVGRFAQAEGN